MIRHVAIIGNGVAGFSAARKLRRLDPNLTISVFSDEQHPFYLRSRLKDFISGAIDDHAMILESRNLYRREHINLFLNSPVTALNTDHSELICGQERIKYDCLLLATGCRMERLRIPGAELRGVFSLRTLQDAEKIRQWATQERASAVVLGEGVVSMQLAESLARLGLDVDLLMRGPDLWPDALARDSADILCRRLQELGVRICPSTVVSEILGDEGRVCAVRLHSGDVRPCRLVAHGCSFRPNVDLLTGTSIEVRCGVVVGAYMETSVPNVFAAGDVVSFGGGEDGKACHFRWHNSFRQGEVAAMNMLGDRQPMSFLAPSVRADVCGLNIAVLGESQLSGGVMGVNVLSGWVGDDYRRLVFREGMLTGATLMGDVDYAAAVESHICHGSTFDDLCDTLVPALLETESRLAKMFRGYCPICTDKVTLPPGTEPGSRFCCWSCGNMLQLCFRDGQLSILPAEDDD